MISLNDQDMIIDLYAHFWNISLSYRNGPKHPKPTQFTANCPFGRTFSIGC